MIYGFFSRLVYRLWEVENSKRLRRTQAVINSILRVPPRQTLDGPRTIVTFKSK